MISLNFRICGLLVTSLCLSSPAFPEEKQIWKLTLNKEITSECETSPGESRIGTRKVPILMNGNLIKFIDGKHSFLFGEQNENGFSVSYWKQSGIEEVSQKSGSSYIFSFKLGEKRAKVIFKTFSEVVFGIGATDSTYCEYTGEAELL